MRAKLIIAGLLIAILGGVVYENVYLAGKKTGAGNGGVPVAKRPMVSPEKAKLRMVYFWGDCKCNENIAAEMVQNAYSEDVHTRIVGLKDPDRMELMRRYKVDKGPYTVFLNPKSGKVLMTQRWATYDDFVESIHELMMEAGYGFAEVGKPVARGIAKVGKPAPDVDIVSEANIGITLDQYRGQKLLLAFLCGCERCRPLVPKLNALVRSQGHDRIAVFGVTAFDKEMRDRFKADLKPEFPICLDPERKTIIHYASEACPRLWLIDEDGVIRYNNKDIHTPTAKLASELHQELGA